MVATARTVSASSAPPWPTYDSPPFRSSAIDPRRSPAAGWACMSASTTITTRNDALFMPKQAASPRLVKTSPPTSGPMDCARLNWMELSATAFGSVWRGTSAGISDWNAGPPNACARPVANDSARM